MMINYVIVSVTKYDFLGEEHGRDNRGRNVVPCALTVLGE
jgi:hypothetical protein